MPTVKEELIATGIPCSSCGAEMVIRFGRAGRFLACRTYPACRNTADFRQTPEGKVEIVPPEPKRAHFQSFTDAMLPKVTMRGSFVRDIYTPRQREPYTAGKAFIYFFPDGHSERAVLHVSSGKPRTPDEEAAGLSAKIEGADVYTLVLHPLTGRVELKTGDLPPPREFDSADDDGQLDSAAERVR